MNLKKKMKGFFSLSRKANDGFTLVELIVVIAILAILSGVAVPAYSGYIAKADKAADEQLLSALNTAFASACVINGEDNFNRSDVRISLTGETGNKTVSTLTVSGNEKIAEAFTKDYYEGGVFKVIESLDYDAMIGGFVDASEAAAKMIAQLKEYFDKSSYNKLALTELTGDVSDLVGELSTFFGASEGNREMLLGSGFSGYLEGLGKTVDELSNTELANAAALYLTNKAAGMTADDIASATGSLQEALYDTYVLKGEPLTKEQVDSWSASTGSNLASYAMLYAAAEAIALENGGKDGDLYKNLKNTNMEDQTAVLNAAAAVFAGTDSTKLEEYLVGGQSAADMEAYFKALQTMNTKEDELVGQLNNDKLFTDSDTVKDLVEQLGG